MNLKIFTFFVISIIIFTITEANAYPSYPITSEYKITSNSNPGSAGSISKLTITTSTDPNANGYIEFYDRPYNLGLEISGWKINDDEIHHFASLVPRLILGYPIVVNYAWINNGYSNGFPVISRTTVESISETVTVPAGTFTNVVKTRTYLEFPSGYNQQIYDDTVEVWYAPNVGFIKIKAHRNTGDFFIGELKNYTIVGTRGDLGPDYFPIQIGNKWVFKWNRAENQADTLFRFVQLTDVHIGPDPGCIFYNCWYLSYKSSIDRSNSIADDIIQLKPDFVLITGDLVEWDNKRWYEDFNKFTSKLIQNGISIYIVPGNHDRRNYIIVGNDLSNYTTYIGSNNYADKSFIYKGFRFIGLDSGNDTSEFDGFTPDFTPEGYGVSEFQIGLLTADRIYPKIVFMHHPAINKKGENDKVLKDNAPGGNDGTIASNRDKFINAVNNYGTKLVLTGHSHVSKNLDSTGLEIPFSGQYIQPPLFVQTRSATKAPYGYLVVDVKTNGLWLQDKIITETKDVRILTIGSPADLHIYDEFGRHTGLNGTGYIENNVPDSYYFEEYKIGNITLPAFVLLYNTTLNYSTRIISNFSKENITSGQSTFNFTIEQKSGDSTTTINYNNVSINWNSTAYLQINETQINYTMQVDLNNDSITDTTKIPDAIETNYAPRATVLSPSNGSIWYQGQPITFNGTGIDVEDGTLTVLSWISDRDGVLGYGNFTRTNLSSGVHNITLLVNDTFGQVNTSNVILTVRDITPPAIQNMKVSRITNTTASINWTTNEYSLSMIKYGNTSGAYSSLITSGSYFAVSHRIDLRELNLATKYYFVANSTDASGNSAQTVEYYFTTASSYIERTVTTINNKTQVASGSGNTTLNITTNKSVSNVPINITEHPANPISSNNIIRSGAVVSAPYLNRFVEIEASDELKSNISVITIRLNYSGADTSGIDESSLRLYWWNESTAVWEVLTDSGVDTANKIVWGNVTHLSLFGAFGNPVSTSTQTQVSGLSGGSSGGGNSGGGINMNEPPDNIAVVDAGEISKVVAGTRVGYAFLEKKTAITAISFDVKKNMHEGISTRIQELKNTSRLINGTMPDGKIYKNININLGVGDSDISNVKIQFRIENSWMESEGISSKEVSLYRASIFEKRQTAWTKLWTAEIDKDNRYTYFESNSPGFSPFAIVGNVKSGLLTQFIEQITTTKPASASEVTPTVVTQDHSISTIGILTGLLGFALPGSEGTGSRFWTGIGLIGVGLGIIVNGILLNTLRRRRD